MACEDQKRELDEARKDLNHAERLKDSAESNLLAAELAYGAGLAGEIACGLTVVTVVGFIACESAAVAAALSGVAWMDSAEKALEVAEEDLEEEKDDYDKALDAYCKCVEGH